MMSLTSVSLRISMLTWRPSRSRSTGAKDFISLFETRFAMPDVKFKLASQLINDEAASAS